MSNRIVFLSFARLTFTDSPCGVYAGAQEALRRVLAKVSHFIAISSSVGRSKWELTNSCNAQGVYSTLAGFENGISGILFGKGISGISREILSGAMALNELVKVFVMAALL